MCQKRRLQRAVVIVQHFPELVQVLQYHTGTQCHTVQRILSHPHRNAGFPLHQLVQTPEQRAAAGEDNAVVDNISRKLRRSLFQGALDGIDDRSQRISQCFPDLLGICLLYTSSML